MPHPLQVEALKQSEGLAQGRSLGPGWAFVDGVAPVVHRDRILDPGHMGRQILLPEERAGGDVPCLELVGHVPFVEAVPGRGQLLFPASAGLPLGVHQFPEGNGQLGMPLFRSGVQDLQHRGRRFREGLGAIELQGGDAKVHGTGRRRGLHAALGRDRVGVVPVDGGLIQRGPSQAGEDLHLLLLGVVDQERDFAADGEHPVVGHRECQQGGGGRIGGVPACFQHPDAGCHRVGVSGRHGASRARGLPTDVARSPAGSHQTRQDPGQNQ